MSSTPTSNDSIFKILGIPLILLFVGTVLFSAIVERFKDDMSSRKEIVTNYYRPLQTDQNACFDLQTKLMTQRGAIAASYKMMSDEFNHISSGTANMTQEYQAWLEIVLTNNTNTHKQVTELSDKVNACKVKLLQEYEELALITGTYTTYAGLLKSRNERYAQINKESLSAREKIEGLPKNADDLYKIIDLIREMTQGNFDAPEDKKAVAAKITAMAKPMIALQTSLIEEDVQVLKADQELAGKLHDIFAGEINTRYTRNFVSRLLF